MTLKLHSYFRSSCSWRVRIALNFKGLDYETIPVHLVHDGGQQHSEEHRKLNPMGQVPVLIVDNEPLGQSMAILEYLEDKHPSPALIGSTPEEKAATRMWHPGIRMPG